MKRILSLGLACLLPGLAWAADGFAELEVQTEGGRHCAADVEIRKAGQTATHKTLAAPAGQVGAGLAPGRYDVSCKARLGGMEGKTTIEVKSGKTHHFVCKVDRPAPAPASAPAGAGGADRPGSISGTAKDKAGAALAEGTARVTIEVPIRAGKFTIGALPAGRYKLEVADKRGKKATTDVEVKAGEAAEPSLRLK